MLRVTHFSIILQASTTNSTTDMKLKVSIDGESHEVDQSDIALPEGVNFISKDNVPKGYFTQDAVNTLVKDNVNSAKDKLKTKLAEDSDFQHKVLNDYNISIGDDGKPKGLKPDFDPEEWKKNEAQKLTKPLREENANLQKEIKQKNESVIQSSILEAVSGNWNDEWVKERGGVIPAVNMYKDQFRVDKEGKPALKTADGTLSVNGKGERIRPKDYLLDPEEFTDMMKDKRQRGSGFQLSGNFEAGNGTPKDWSVDKKTEFIEKNGRDAWKDLLNRSKAEKN